MNIISLVNALGICIDTSEDDDPRLEYIWGDEMFSDWGSQLACVNEAPIVLYKNNSNRSRSGILHEACHAIFGDEDETRIFAYEWLVAKELTGEDKKNWAKFFSVCIVTADGDEGEEILKCQNPNKLPEDWKQAFFWLEENGFSHNKMPVYGLGPAKSFLRGINKNTYYEHVYKHKGRNKI